MINKYAILIDNRGNMTYSMQSITFEVLDSLKRFPEANVQIKKSMMKPFGVSFRCSRTVPWINKNIYTVYMHAIGGDAAQDLSLRNNCSHDFKRKVGTMRNILAECSCDNLNRMKYPYIRKNFENKVIETILQILGSDKSFNLKLAFLDSGKLLSEQILLFRLINELKKKECKGTIELFFIDYCYQQLDVNSYCGQNFEEALGYQKEIQQFLREMSLCLPETIILRGEFFSDPKKYISEAKNSQSYQHDFLIDCNFGDDSQEKNIIAVQEVGRGRDPLVLSQKDDTPLTWELKSSKSSEKYSVDGGGKITFEPILETSFSIVPLIPIAIVVGMVVLTVLAFTKPKSNN